MILSTLLSGPRPPARPRGARRSIENPNVPLSSKNIVAFLRGGIGTDAGIAVDERTALMYSAVMSAVRIISESVAVLPIKVFRRLPQGGKQVQPQHPAHRLIHDQPNPDMTPATFKETITGHLLTWGNGFALIRRDDGGNVRELWPLRPDQTQAQRLETTGELRIVATVDSVAERRRLGLRNRVTMLDPMEVLHIPGLGFDGLTGYSPIGMARQAIGIALAAEQFSARFYKNGAWMGGVLEHPDLLGDEALDHLDESIKSKHSGAVNAFNPLILEEGMKWHQVGLPGEDAMFLELRKFQKREIASLYRIPPHLMADLEKGASFASLEQQSLDFVKHTLAIWLTKWEEECTRKLTQRSDTFCEFTLDAFLRGDIKSRFEAYEKAINMGLMSINEARDRENLSPAEGGDSLFRPLNFAPINGPVDVEDGVPSNPPPDDGGSGHLDDDCPKENARSGDDLTAHIMEAQADVLDKELDRLWRVQRDRIGRYAAKTETLLERAKAFYGKHREAMVDALLIPAGAAARALAALDGHEFERRHEDACISCVSEFADGWTRTCLTYIEMAGGLPEYGLARNGRSLLSEVATAMKGATP